MKISQGQSAESAHLIFSLFTNGKPNPHLNKTLTSDGEDSNIVDGLLYIGARAGIGVALDGLAKMIMDGVHTKDLDGNDISREKRYEVAGQYYRWATISNEPLAPCDLVSLIIKGLYHTNLSGQPLCSEGQRHQAIKDIFRHILRQSAFTSESFYNPDIMANSVIKAFIKNIATQTDAEEEFDHIINYKYAQKYRAFYEALFQYLRGEDFDMQKANLALQTDHEDAFVLYSLWQEDSREREAQRTRETSSPSSQTREGANQEASLYLDDDILSDEDSPEGLEMAGAAAAEGSATQSEEESQEIQAYTIPKTQREAVKQKTIKAVRDAKESFMSKKLAPISAEPRPSVRITWSEEARADLKTLTQEMGQAFRSDRLPLLLETLKEFQCAGANSIEVLKHAKHNGKRVFSGRIDREHRLCATRTYDNKGNVTGIHLLSLSGHY